jgi:hypothetical protein
MNGSAGCEPRMIDEADQELRDWVVSVIPNANVITELPQAAGERPAIHLFLLEVQNGVPNQREHARSFEFLLRYLVTVSAADSEAAHRLFGQLLLAAMERSDCQVELRAFTPEFWIAIGASPRPAFFLVRPLVIARAQQVTRVRQPVELRFSPSATLSGVVLTRFDTPVARARVEMVDSTAVTYTDARGRFQFGAMPAHALAKPLRVIAKGLEVVVPQRARTDEPLVIRFDPKET